MLRSLESNLGFETTVRSKCGRILASKSFSNILVLESVDNLLEITEDLDEEFPSMRSYVFLSKHKSESRVPTLTSHSTGNFGKITLGGKPRELAISYPSFQKQYMKELVRNRNRVQGYDIVIEATHHGPTSLKKPVTFLELGSSEQQWLDNNAALTICKTAVDVLKQEIPLCKRVAIAIGGTHYPSKLSALLLDSDLGLGAIASKHNLENIDEEMVGQMCSRSIEKITHAIVDIKSLKSNKTKILNLIEEAGLDLVTV